MTVERTIFIRSPADVAEELSGLHAKAEASLRRASKLPPGDTSEIARFEALSAQIERRALTCAAANPDLAVTVETGLALPGCLLSPGMPVVHDNQIPDVVRGWISEGAVVVVATLPHIAGSTGLVLSTVGPSPPAERWKSSKRKRRDAESERFETQIQRALTGDDLNATINPSAVSNRVLTETLREHVHAGSGAHRKDVPVTYRDGSTADPFPFQVLTLSDAPLPDLPIMRFTLLSIRHVEMDEKVDGAWFRNSRISLNRPAGLTDADAFAISVKQLEQMRSLGSVVVEMYQTGLQPAVMGFYRAVTHALIEHPGSIHVVPMFFAGSGFDKGKPWQTK
ncbi:MAG: hypothetical protein AB2541_00535 [Candidatus Thiodiazotropha sp.]